MIVRELINLIGFKLNEGQFRAAEAGVNRLTRSMQHFGLKATFFLTAPFIGLNIWLGKTLSDFEQMEVAFETMLGSASKADKLITDMLHFAAKTPFEVKNIGNVVKQLLATGSSAETVLDDLRILGNAAAGLSQPITRLALNFGQVRAQGKLTGRDMKDFTIAGINMRKELRKIVGAGADIDKMVTKGEISFETMREVFVKMSGKGGLFHNLMVKQAKTLGGLWSNFKDIIVLTAKEFSSDLLPVFKKIVLFFIKMVDVFKNDISPTMKKTLFIIGALLGVIGPLTLALTILISVGKVLASTFILISGAAKAAHLSTLVFMAKFLLIGLLIVGVTLLSLALYDELMTEMKGGKTVLGEFETFLDKLQKKLEDMRIFTLSIFRDMFKEISDSMDRFFDSMFSLFSGKWKKFWNELNQSALNAFNALAQGLLGIFQPIFDLLNKIFGTKLNLAEISRKTDELIIEAAKLPFKVGKDLFEKAVMGTHGAIGGMLFGDITSPMQGVTNFNINSKITIPVPEGTPAEQVERLDKTARHAVTSQFEKEIRNLTHSLPEVE